MKQLFSRQTAAAANCQNILERLQNNDQTAVSDCLAAYGEAVWEMVDAQFDSTVETEVAVFEIFSEVWRYAGCFGLTDLNEKDFVMLVAQRHLSKIAQQNQAGFEFQ